MATISSSRTLPHNQASPLKPTVTLALWQWPQVWHLLVCIGIGITVAVILASTISLYSWIALSAGLRDVFVADPSNAFVTLNTSVNRVSRAQISQATARTAQVASTDLSPYFSHTTQSITQVTGLNFSAPAHDTARSGAVPNTLELSGQDMSLLQPHVRLLQGRLPQTSHQAGGLEVALSADSARYLAASVGTVLTVQLPYIVQHSIATQSYENMPLPLHVVGIFQNRAQDDPFWHTNPPGMDQSIIHLVQRVVLSETALLDFLQALPTSDAQHTPVAFDFKTNLSWFYPLSTSQMDVNQLSSFQNGLYTFSTDATKQFPSTTFPSVNIAVPTAVLQQYSDHIAIAQLPATILTLFILGLLALFISLLNTLLVERQHAALAILRSRGANHLQVAAALLLQTLPLLVLALLIGPWLSIPVTVFLVHSTLSLSEQGALHLLTSTPLQALGQVAWVCLGTAVLMFLALALAIYRATSFDVLALRHESARTTRLPFWQRFYLDVLALLAALICYGLVLYETSQGILDARLRVLLQAPLTLLSVAFLLLAAALFFLRLFPLLLALCMRFAVRGRGIVSLLSLDLLLRSPQQALRMILLLTFSLLFATFSLVFTFSQQQHMRDVAAYQTGADFSGSLPQASAPADETAAPLPQPSLGQLVSTYQAIPGVTATTAGYIGEFDLPTQNSSTGSSALRFLAIDPTTFASATTWSQLQSPALQTQLSQLTSQREALLLQLARVTPVDQQSDPSLIAAPTFLLPTLVDQLTWDTYHLHAGMHFPLSNYQALGDPDCLIIGVIPSIPSVNDQTGVGNGEPGMLIDYQSYATIVATTIKRQVLRTNTPLTPNTLWLRTSDDSRSLATVRAALLRGRLRLDSLNDRRAILSDLQRDPLYLNFIGILTLGAAAPLLLALLGNLLASWWYTRSRISSFVVLRALGSNTRQLTLVLLAEQCLIYLTALILGLAGGLLLSWLCLPSLVFTTSSAATAIFNQGNTTGTYDIQRIPPLQLVIPVQLLLVPLILLGIAAIVLSVIVRTATRPSLAQTLRINED